MAIKKIGKRKKHACNWCDAPAVWQLVTNWGVSRTACRDHLADLVLFSQIRQAERKEAEENYKIRQSFRSSEPSLAEMDLGVH